MTTTLSSVRDLCRVNSFYAERIGILRAEANETPETGPRAYLSGGSTQDAYRAIRPWYRLVEPLYAEVEHRMQGLSQGDAERILEDQEVQALLPSLHRIRAAYEFDKEIDEARALLNSDDPASEIAAIIRHQSYWIFTDEVLEALSGSRAVAVIGSGPLPLTALAVAAQTGIQVTCFERDPVAFDLGNEIIARSSYGARIECRNVEARGERDLEAFDVAFCAVLLGVSIGSENHADKTALFEGFLSGLKPGGRLIARDPYRLGALFYPKAGPLNGPGILATRYDPETGLGLPYRSAFLIVKKGADQ
ncbi:MAG: nicotianamine synthase family protein [Pseudomonadota bacterium]